MKGRLLLLVFFPSLLLFSTIGIHLIEYRVMENEDYRSILDCLYWTVVTISTVGFGDMSPVHTPGRVFTLFVIAGGVVNYSLIISLIISHFRHLTTNASPLAAEERPMLCHKFKHRVGPV